MKKTALFILLLAAAVSAQAAIGPVPNANYTCYYRNYSGLAVNGGVSRFDIAGSATPRRGIEYFDAYHPRFGHFTENQKVTFANPRPIRIVEDGIPQTIGWSWSFGVNPSGPQCMVEIYDNGNSLYFFNCNDGHARDCYR